MIWTGQPFVSLIILICLPWLWTLGVDGRSQYFVTKPQNKTVIQGSPVVLECAVGSRKGAVQWTKDGFALGFNSSIPGYDRYSIDSSNSREFNLVIASSQVSDDAAYACQVLPGGRDAPIQARASLTVTVPCQPPQILGHLNHTIVQLPFTQKELNLTCQSRHGRPAATVEWFRNGQKATSGVTRFIEPSPSDKRETSVSTIRIPLTSKENGALYQCRANNSGILGEDTMRTSVKLSIISPPGPPQISGYPSNRVAKVNDTLILKCVVTDGNQPAAVTWYRNQEPVDWSFSSKRNQSTNLYTFRVDRDDNKVVYRCEVKNLVTLTPLTAQFNLTVYFPPKSVTMTGATQPVKANRHVTLTCVTSKSNPKATIMWFARNSPVDSSKVTETSKASPGGGFITTSRARVRVSHQDHRTVYTCQATNSEFGQTVADTHTLSVLYPPGAPVISGYNEGNIVKAGHLERMTCVSLGGNPVATLKWYKGNSLIEDASYKTVGNVASSEIAFVLKADDNGATYKCKASNSATSSSLQARIKLTVQFPPSQVSIFSSDPNPSAGASLNLTCVSSSSNPAAEITWIKNGRHVVGIDLGSTDAENGGRNTTSRLEMDLTAKDHDTIVGCRATNRVLGFSQTNALTLNLTFRPSFDGVLVDDTADVIKGEVSKINLTASANPPAQKYALKKKDGKAFTPPSRFKMSPQGVLTVSSVRKEDHAVYTVEAENSLGKVAYNFTINVQFPAQIKSLTNRQTKNEGETAEFSCQVEANPVIPNIVTWSRSDSFDMSRTSVRVEGDTSYLTVPDLVKGDGGRFKCVADNKIGSSSSKTARLVVRSKSSSGDTFQCPSNNSTRPTDSAGHPKSAPVIDKSPEMSHVAKDTGSDVTLKCQADGVPGVALTWKKGSRSIKCSVKYTLSWDHKGIRNVSSLTIKNLRSSDYGSYTCTASNSEGRATHTVKLSETSKPYTPESIRGDNVTSSTINVSWKPGFNGGLPQSFRVRYKPTEARGYMYVDVRPYGATSYKITGLDLSTMYEFSVKAFNKKGESIYLDKSVNITTSATPPHSEDTDLPVIVILITCIVATFVLLLNIVLVFMFIRWRRRKTTGRAKVKDTASLGSISELYDSLGGKGDDSVSDDSMSYHGDEYDARYGDLPGQYLKYSDDDYDYSQPYSHYHTIPESLSRGGHRQMHTDPNVPTGRNSLWKEDYRYVRYEAVAGDNYNYSKDKHVEMDDLCDVTANHPSTHAMGSSSAPSGHIPANPHHKGPAPPTPLHKDSLPAAGLEFRGLLV